MTTDYTKALAALRELHHDPEVTYSAYWFNEYQSRMGDLLAAIDAQQPLFLLHTGTIYGNERGDWEVEADSGKAVDAYCDANPGKTVALYAAPPAAVPEGYALVPVEPSRDAVANAIWLATKAYGSLDHDRPSLSAEPRPLQKLIYEQADAAIIAMLAAAQAKENDRE